MRAYVFVDAENHYLRSVEVLRKVFGSEKRALEALTKIDFTIGGFGGFPRYYIEGNRFGCNSDLQLFWDCHILSPGGILTPIPGVRIIRAVYVCSCTGDPQKVHGMREQLRKYDFEPIVIPELKDLQKQRELMRNRDLLLQKPKGCDIAIASRMVADAAANLYDCCFLFTSDADFLPAIEAVRGMGKIVWVFGYRDALPKQSPYLYVPDKFIDLRGELDSTWNMYRRQLVQALEELEE